MTEFTFLRSPEAPEDVLVVERTPDAPWGDAVEPLQALGYVQIASARSETNQIDVDLQGRKHYVPEMHTEFPLLSA